MESNRQAAIRYLYQSYVGVAKARAALDAPEERDMIERVYKTVNDAIEELKEVEGRANVQA